MSIFRLFRDQRLYPATDGSGCRVSQPKLGNSMGVLRRRERKDQRHQRVRGIMRIWPKVSPSWDYQGPVEIRNPVGSDLVPLHMCYG